jgi:hypothetical protein
LIAGMIGVFSITGYTAYWKQQYGIFHSLERKLAAENSASELLELFKAMGPVGVPTYLSQKGLPLCKPINLPDSQGQVQYRDQMAAGDSLEALTPAITYRGYEIDVVDLSTMRIQCELVDPHITLSSTQAYLIKAQVVWGVERVVLSTLITNPSTVTLTPAPACSDFSLTSLLVKFPDGAGNNFGHISFCVKGATVGFNPSTKKICLKGNTLYEMTATQPEKIKCAGRVIWDAPYQNNVGDRHFYGDFYPGAVTSLWPNEDAFLNLQAYSVPVSNKAVDCLPATPPSTNTEASFTPNGC